MYQRKKNSNKNFIIPTEGVKELNGGFEDLGQQEKNEYGK
jgi:hypothetical protein